MAESSLESLCILLPIVGSKLEQEEDAARRKKIEKLLAEFQTISAGAGLVGAGLVGGGRLF